MISTTTIQEARQIIGEDADGMTDEQLARIVAALDIMAEMVIDNCIEKHRQAIKARHQQKAA